MIFSMKEWLWNNREYPAGTGFYLDVNKHLDYVEASTEPKTTLFQRLNATFIK